MMSSLNISGSLLEDADVGSRSLKPEHMYSSVFLMLDSERWWVTVGCMVAWIVMIW
jgi:hypothetical protein